VKTWIWNFTENPELLKTPILTSREEKNSEVEFLEKHPIYPELKFRVFEFWGNISNRS
jgi:hypothetical protein